jgi:putative SOS response-associated peptidase YedK
MPLILNPADQAQWLDPANQDAEALKALLVPYPADEMEVNVANPLVNSPRNDRPECPRPVA